ncbi:hypothetical protein M513_12151 [Trichuris suis]|uniref:Uncharacterized protein n=1 Tax=Trichuris suis TaxID=68888 RepID=A0A085LPR5_9BILA|nr:hypothetical protein M513_12151 [Trichuris suis]
MDEAVKASAIVEHASEHQIFKFQMFEWLNLKIKDLFGSSWKSVVRVEKILEDVDRARDWDAGEEVLYVIADENVGGDTVKA